jgi:c-di-GMP-binding flagellar brake protein YcgR
MATTAQDRRFNQRYSVHIPIHFRVSQHGAVSRWGSGTTGDLSSSGVRFRCRKPLPVSAHIEMVIDWPAKQEGDRQIHLHATGFIVRSTGHETAVRMNSCRFQIDEAAAKPMGATA